MSRFLRVQSTLFLCLSALCWGPSYLFIKIAIPTIGAFTLAFLRVFIAAIMLYGICYILKIKTFEWRHYIKHYLILGLFLNVVPQCLIMFGEAYISSALAGILNSFTVIFTAILAHFFGTHEPLNKNRVLGILFGFTGLGIIYLPILISEATSSFWGASMIVLSSLSYAIGTLYVRAHVIRKNNMLIITAQCLISALVLLPFALLIDRPFAHPMPAYEALWGALGLGIIGTVGGFLFFYKTIQLAGATYASFSLLLVPIIAMCLGALFLNEQLTWNLYLGTFFILAGTIGVNPILNKTS